MTNSGHYHTEGVVADELVRVERFPGTSEEEGLTWVVKYGVPPSASCLLYESRDAAEEAARSLRTLVNEALKRYKRSESAEPVGDTSAPTTPESVGPDLFAGTIQSMTAILGKVADLLGMHAVKVIDLMTVARNLCLEIEHLPGVAAGLMTPLSSVETRDLLQKSSTLKDAVESLSKEW